MRVLDLGPGLAPGFAGLILRENGHAVTRWAPDRDAIRDLQDGDLLWRWLYEGVSRQIRDPFTVDRLQRGVFGAVIEAIPRYEWQEHKIVRDVLARRLGVYWVSLEMEDGSPVNELR